MTRIFDLFCSITALLVFLPFMIPIVFLLLFTGEGKVFYRQQRTGRNNKTFNLLKFATMLEDSPNLPGGDITSGNDPRVLPVGKILRKTKVNELPQLINILLGEISIIGPRPLTPKNFQMYNKFVQEKISSVRPGLSGIGSTIFRDEESVIALSPKTPIKCYQEDISPYKGELECWYVDNKSIYLYVALIVITVWVVIFPKSKIIWKLFPKLPSPPDVLKIPLNFSL